MTETPVTTTRISPAPHIAVDHIGSGPLVLFLHGIGGNRTNWRGQLAVFGERFTAVAWDARGYGDSDDYDGALHFADFSNDLLRVLDYFGAEQAHLVGQSMGGRIALDFYGRHPQRVASLTLASTSVARRGEEKRLQDEEALKVRQRPLTEEGKTPADIAPLLAKKLAGPTTPPDVFQRIVESMAALRKDSYLKTLETVVRYESFPPFESINVPCLVLTGEHDQLATPDTCRRMAAQLPNAQFVILPGVGHMSQMEAVGVFNEVVLRFLSKQ
jgi:3-oxoadipate enol-lactonase